MIHQIGSKFSLALFLTLILSFFLNNNNNLLTFTHAIGPIIPQLSSVFKASVTISSMGNVRKGTFYYDLPNNRFRLDTTGLGGTLASVAHFDDMIQHDINIPNGPCNIKRLEQDLYQLTIPPTAFFVQNVVVNGKKCSRWRASIPPYDMDYWVTSTMSNNVEIFELVRFKSQYPAMVGFVENQIDFSDFQPSYDLIETFKVSNDWGCPLKRVGYYYVNGYTRSAMTGDILTNVLLHMTLDQKKYVTKSGKDGIFRFDHIPLGSKIEIGNDDPAGGYALMTKSLTITGNVNVNTFADLYLSPSLPKDKIRAVLTWNYSPVNLNLQVLMPDGQCQVDPMLQISQPAQISACCHLQDCAGCCNNGEAILERDVTRGWGSEVITISPKTANGTFKFFVYNYGNEGAIMNAIVKVYNSQGLVQEIISTNQKTGRRYWNVFHLVYSNGKPEIVIINNLSDSIN